MTPWVAGVDQAGGTKEGVMYIMHPLLPGVTLGIHLELQPRIKGAILWGLMHPLLAVLRVCSLGLDHHLQYNHLRMLLITLMQHCSALQGGQGGTPGKDSGSDKSGAVNKCTNFCGKTCIFNVLAMMLIHCVGLL